MNLFKNTFSFQKNRNQAPCLIIVEGYPSYYSYHLRLVTPGEEKYSGGAGLVLCGKTFDQGWDVKFPLSSYGMKDHLGSRWCEACRQEAQKNNLHGNNEITSKEKTS